MSHEWGGGVAVCGRSINNLRYADDTNSGKLIKTGKYHDKIYERNISKTKVMSVDRADNNSLHITKVTVFEVVNRFKFLGATNTNTGGN